MIKRLVLAAVLGVLATGTAYANCYTETYFVNGKVTTCMICVTGNNRTVNCF